MMLGAERMLINEKLVIAKNSEKELYISPEMINRHGIITGATGTGKTVSVHVLAESFSAAGIPVFVADIKGDLSGICEPGENNDNIKKRLDSQCVFAILDINSHMSEQFSQGRSSLLLNLLSNDIDILALSINRIKHIISNIGIESIISNCFTNITFYIFNCFRIF